MEEEPDDNLGFNSCTAAPFIVSLSPFSPIPTPSSRRLSANFTPTQPVKSARSLAWISLQGRLVNADEASSVEAIGGGLRGEEAVAWELFSPVQRFLMVAVIGVAVAESKKNRIISQLTRSIELRDKVLSSMQQKLDGMCEQLNAAQIEAKVGVITPPYKNLESLSNDVFGSDNTGFADCVWHHQQHQEFIDGSKEKGDEVLPYKMSFNYEAEPEERRMSDLSDWASSIASASEIQVKENLEPVIDMNTFTVDHDLLNLKRECDEKDAIIKELTTILQSTKKAGSKRIGDLEDIIRRKNAIVTRLRKDVMVLEQKMTHLARRWRPSTSASILDGQQAPLMMDNIVYDMDSTTSPSSSDSDSSPGNKPQAASDIAYGTSILDKFGSPLSSDSDASPVKQRRDPVESRELASISSSGSVPAKPSSSLVRTVKLGVKSQATNPPREISSCQRSNKPLSRSRRPFSTGPNVFKIKARTQATSTDAAPKKRWT